MGDEVFTFKDGNLYCENVRIKQLQNELAQSRVFPSSPVFVYSRRKLVGNIKRYQQALKRLPTSTELSYSMKANASPALLWELLSRGCWVTLVSGMELLMAATVGFPPHHIIFNGNGKQDWERTKALELGCLLNADSCFDLRQTLAVCKRQNVTANILLRFNPDIDPEVHPYISTGLAASKFGVGEGEMMECISVLQAEASHLKLVGLHCHLGSTIVNTDVFRSCACKLMELKTQLQREGFQDIQYINIGGGLGIDYKKWMHDSSLLQDQSSRASPVGCQSENGKNLHSRTKVPTPNDLVDSVVDVVKDKDVTLIVEPGRSIVGDTAILAATVMGTKHNTNKNFIVTDAAMTEVLRPSLYGAYHHIALTEPGRGKGREPDQQSTKMVYDVVGPVCEGADFLGRDRELVTPHDGCGLAVFDTGAYCSSMASNYNMRLRPCEVMVDGDTWKLIRRPDTFQDLMRPHEGLWETT